MKRKKHISSQQIANHTYCTARVCVPNSASASGGSKINGTNDTAAVVLKSTADGKKSMERQVEIETNPLVSKVKLFFGFQ